MERVDAVVVGAGGTTNREAVADGHREHRPLGAAAVPDSLAADRGAGRLDRLGGSGAAAPSRVGVIGYATLNVPFIEVKCGSQM